MCGTKAWEGTRRAKLKRQISKRREKITINPGMQHLPSNNRVWEASGWRACVSKQCVRQRLQRKVGHLSEIFFSVKVQNLHDVGVNSSIPSKQGTEVDWGSCVMKLFLFLASSLHTFTSFLSPKYPEAHEEWVMIILHFLGRQWFCPASSLLAFLAPASCCPHPLVLLWRSMKEFFFSPYHQVKNGRRLWKLCV